MLYYRNYRFSYNIVYKDVLFTHEGRRKTSNPNEWAGICLFGLMNGPAVCKHNPTVYSSNICLFGLMNGPTVCKHNLTVYSSDIFLPFML